jgi:hypothetical protein
MTHYVMTHRLYQGVLPFRNVVRCHDTHVYVILLTLDGTVRTSCTDFHETLRYLTALRVGALFRLYISPYYTSGS